MRYPVKLKVLLLSCLLIAIRANLKAQNFYHQPTSSSEILHKLMKCEVTGSVMYIAAHPDDENTRLISWITNDLKANVTYLSLTRGDGGQNLVGPEIRDGLGVIRTQELLQARKTDGGEQMFTRANDFGYSKTPEESFTIWDRKKVLADVVWAIRKTRPDVIITRFSTEKREGRATHGHHTASAILAAEAFDLAGDPDAFPEQLEYVSIWQPKRLFWNTSWWFFGSAESFDKEIEENPGKYLKLEVSKYIGELGLSCSEIASLSRSHHKSQGFGSTPDRGEEYEYLQIIKGEPVEKGIFDGVDLSWGRIGLGDHQKKLQKIISNYSINSPQRSVDELFGLLKTIKRTAATDEHLRHRLINQINEIIFLCSGVYIEATYSEELVASGDQITVNVRAVNRVPDIDFDLTECGFGPNKMQKITNHNKTQGVIMFEQEISLNRMPISQPYWLNNQSTTGMYHVDDQMLIGLPNIENNLFFNCTASINGNNITRKIPIVYSATDPVKGEVKHPLIVTPSVMVDLEEDVYLFKDQKARNVTMEVIAGTDNIAGYAELNIPEGWSCEPKFHHVELEKRGDRRRVTFTITPTKENYDGTIAGYFKTDTDVYGLGFQLIKYDHIIPQAIFNSCEARLVRIDIATDPDIRRIGYIQGAGDMVPGALSLMGYEVDQLIPQDISSEVLGNYDAVVVGIRAYNTVNEMAYINGLLNAFVQKGGVVVVQYNTAHRLVTTDIGPYPIELSRERVTEENAKVEFIEANNKILDWPNKITQEDFSNWVQERGLYFPGSWADEYQTVIRIADIGETPSEGSILVAGFGKGRFVYTGLSFFRQFPAGVPGSYRLMANLLSNP